ncbi:MAG TPA: hypothetical protein DCZ80_08065 [Legionellales bacterium]|nr:hypothetical protein [Legionellales bacterium]
MFQKFFAVVGISLSLCSLNGFAQSSEMYLEETVGAGTPINLAANETKVIGNAFTCTMHINCDMTCENDVTNIIHFTILNRGGSLNGQPVNKGDSMNVEIRTGDKLSIMAKPASRVELKNIGATKISSMCLITCK